MQISYNWLLEYLPKELSVDELSAILTGIGLEVEGVDLSEAIPGSLAGLVVGEVKTCVQHPNADILKLTTVSTGSDELLHIVCGAPNVAAGQKVIVATIGTVLHPVKGAAFEIKKSKIRGEVSEGMICAEDEIGLGESHAGIMVLPEDTPVGMPAKDFFHIPPPDYTFHIGLTPNRSDAMSHIGVARDVCAYLAHHEGLPLQQLQDMQDAFKNEQTDIQLNTATEKSIHISIEAPEACKRYAGIVLSDIRIAASPEWMQRRLMTIGVRPVNNIVDITNYVLHEYGQPLHAFDYDTIQGRHIRVKNATEGEKFTTLDNVERTLRQDDLMICDAEKPMCIAGVFGGQGSGISDNTTTVFIESAYFDPRSIRLSSLHHQLRTDAALHFEKSVDVSRVIPALKRAVQLIRDIAGGKVASALTDWYPEPLPQHTVPIQYAYINKLCGKQYAKDTVDNILQALGFVITAKDDDRISLLVPTDKSDVRLPADIVEEILRIDGLDQIPFPGRLNIPAQNGAMPKERKWKEVMANFLSGKGLREIVTNSITNSRYYPGNDTLVSMINSLSSELDVLRPSMLESGLEVLRYNINRKQQHLALYETGHVYSREATGKYQQQAHLAVWISGLTQVKGWQDSAVKADIYYLKGLIESLFTCCGLKKYQEVTEGATIIWQRGTTLLGKAFSVSPEQLRSFDIKQPVFYAEIYMKPVVQAVEHQQIRYAELPKYPAVKRDLALVLDKQVRYEALAKATQKAKIEALQNFHLFDLFENEKLGKDKKSLALSFTFQLFDRTLTDAEVDMMMKKLIALYQKEFQAEIRE